MLNRVQMCKVDCYCYTNTGLISAGHGAP